MILKLENTTTHQIYEYEVKDMNNGEKLYFRFDIDTSDLVDGEYILSLYDGEKLVANDLLKIGDFNTNTLQYKKGENIYIEVKLDESVQEVKNISISTIETTVLPDDGFNSMGKVDVNAQPLYDNAYHIGHTEGYNEGLESSYQVGYDDGYSVGNEEGYNNGYNVGNEDGYKQGKTDGINTQKSKLETISITNNGTYEREDGYNKIIVDVPDTNGSYDEGYAEGISNGLAQGEINGINIQKEKLESITITENGTYTREDGYNSIEVNIEDTNGSYDEGYADGIEEGTSNAGEIIAQTAQVLNVTKNGTYTTQYSQYDDYTKPEQITGDFGDGKYFYNCANYDYYYNTEIKPTIDKRLEFWIKDNNPTEYNNNVFIGIDDLQSSDFYFGKNYTKRQYEAKIGNSLVYFNQTDIWLHIIMSIADGLIVNGEKIGDFEKTNVNYYNNFTIGIQGGGTSPTIGMVKIDDQIIIPTDNELLNITTGEYLSKVSETIDYNYTYINNFTEPIAEGNLIKTVNVNVAPKIDVVKDGIKFGYSSFNEIPEYFDFEGIIDMNNMFYNCGNLHTIPLINTSNVTTMYQTFYNCGNLQTIPQLDTSNVTSMRQMFCYCGSLQNIPQLNTSNVTDFLEMFSRCSALQTIPQLDTSKATTIERMFTNCNNLVSIPPLDMSNMTAERGPFGTSDLPNLTDVGGFINLKVNWNYTYYGINKLPNLTYQSCINILNGLWDFRGNGDATTTRTLKVHQNFLNLVGDEISIGVQKGWIITA